MSPPLAVGATPRTCPAFPFASEPRRSPRTLVWPGNGEGRRFAFSGTEARSSGQKALSGPDEKPQPECQEDRSNEPPEGGKMNGSNPYWQYQPPGQPPGGVGGTPPPGPPFPVGSPRLPGGSPRGWRRLPRGAQIGVVVAVFVAFVGVIVAIGLSKSGDSGSSGTVATSSTASAVPFSKSDDWERAVCRPGTFFNGSRGLPNSTGSASCMALNDQVPILIGTYTSSFALENDMAIYKGRTYATIETQSGSTCVFLAMMPGGGAALSPLEQFGFEMHQSPTS